MVGKPILGEHMNYLPRLRGGAVAAAIAVVVVSVVAVAPRMAAHNGQPVPLRLAAQGSQSGAQSASAPSTYNGTVSNNGSGTTVYDYNGASAPGTGAPSLGTLPDGTQVHVQCYTVGDPVTGPNGQGAGGTDEYWDQIDTASAAMPQVPAGDTAVVPDAYVQTSAPVNELVPNCDGVVNDAGGSSGTSANGNAGDNGTVSNNGSGTTVYDHNGGNAPGTGAPSLGTLPDGTQVHVQCYTVGDPVTGPNVGSPGTELEFAL